MLLANLCFAEVELSQSAQLMVKGFLEGTLSLKEVLASKENGAILCLEKFARHLESVDHNINDILQQAEYSNIKTLIQANLELARADKELIRLRTSALLANKSRGERWEELRWATLYFVGSLMETRMPKRFSHFLMYQEETDWLNRNEKVDPITDYDDFIAGIISYFHVSEIMISH